MKSMSDLKFGYVAKTFTLIIAGAITITFSGCDKKPNPKGGKAAQQSSKITLTKADKSIPAVRTFDKKQIDRGRALFEDHCVQCHGLNGEGDPDWRTPDAYGVFGAPPLDGTGHAWHHPMHVLIDYIKLGGERYGGTMPPKGEELNDDQILDVIAWFQSQWSDKIYTAWYKRFDKDSEAVQN